MKNTLKIDSEERKTHLLVWVLLSVLLIFLDEDPITPFNLYCSAFVMINYALNFYLLFFFVLPHYNFRKYFKSFLICIFVLFLFLSGDIFIFTVIDNYFSWGDILAYSESGFMRWLINDVFLFVIMTICAIAYYQYKLQKHQIEKESEMKKFLIKKNISFYESQFNSHIINNFLNYCYAMLIDTSEKTAKMMELYSAILKDGYELKYSDRITLEKELNYIEKFLQLKRLLDESLFYEIHTTGNLKSNFIAPRLFITLVENAIKHGICNTPEKPIVVTIDVQNDMICCKVSNFKRIGKRAVNSTGVGLKNLKQQLLLFYETNFNFKIIDSKDNFSATIEILK